MNFRVALLTLMMVLMLPLGALNAWVPTVADAAPHSIQPAAQSSAQTPRNCRSGFLPAAGCAKFLKLAETGSTSSRSAEPDSPRVQAWRVQHRPTPPKAPPRTA